MTDREFNHVLYLNGLERTNDSDPTKSIPRYLESHNISTTPMAVDWYSSSFPDLLNRGTELTEEKLRQHGRVALVGASAGGSLSVNIFQRIRADNPDSDISLVSLSGRLKLGDPKNFEEVLINQLNKKQSLVYSESVSRCEKVSAALSEKDRKLMRTVQPLTDQVVPLNTMSIDGVESYTVSANGHTRGIARGILLIPTILDDIYASI
jgi:hypothetical protein